MIVLIKMCYDQLLSQIKRKNDIDTMGHWHTFQLVAIVVVLYVELLRQEDATCSWLFLVVSGLSGIDDIGGSNNFGWSLRNLWYFYLAQKIV